MRKWEDEYWLPLMQVFLASPQGVKPIYSRRMVELALELHIPPQDLYRQMFKLRQIETPLIEHFWKKYAKSPRKLQKEIDILREMSGFGQADTFYDGVEVSESWETDFRPLPERPELTPLMLIIILDLYFRLTPNTMVSDTPEVRELAKMMRISTETVVEVMTIYQYCDPYLKRDVLPFNPIFETCNDIWIRYGNGRPEQLSSLAAQMKEYFKN